MGKDFDFEQYVTESMSEERIKRCIQDALESYKNADETEIKMQIGLAAIQLGVKADVSKDTRLLAENLSQDIVYKDIQKPIMKSLSSYRSQREKYNRNEEEAAVNIGTDIWENFKRKAKEYICGDNGILVIMEKSKIEDALKIAIPALLVKLGLAELWIPVIAIIVVSLLILLLKAGIEAFCST